MHGGPIHITPEILLKAYAAGIFPMAEDADDPLGKIVYYVNISPSTSTDQLSEEIFGSDPDNIDSIQWDQKKSNSYIYR